MPFFCLLQSLFFSWYSKVWAPKQKAVASYTAATASPSQIPNNYSKVYKSLGFMSNTSWASSWDNGTYDTATSEGSGESAKSRQSLRCSHTQSMVVEEGSDQKSDV